MQMNRALLVIGVGILACSLGACASHEPTKSPEPSAPAEAESGPRSAWVYAKGDGEHPGMFIAIRSEAGKLVPMVVMTPLDAPDDAAKGAQIPLKDVESTDRRVCFRMEPVTEMIVPFRMIIEFDAPLAGEVVQGYFAVDPADAALIHAEPEDLRGKRAPAEFKKMPLPMVPTWEERRRAEQAQTQPVQPPVAGEAVWCGSCDAGLTTPGKLKFKASNCFVQIVTRGDKVTSCKVIERRSPREGGDRVLLEVTDPSGSLRYCRGFAVVDGVKHPYTIRGEKGDSRWSIGISDGCRAMHPPSDTPYFSAEHVMHEQGRVPQ